MDNGKGSRNNGKGKNTPGSSTGASTTAVGSNPAELMGRGEGRSKDEGKDQGKDEGKDKGDKGGGGKDKGDKGGGDGKGKEGKTGQDADRAWIAFFSGHCSYRSGGPTARASAAAAPSEGAPHGIPK